MEFKATESINSKIAFETYYESLKVKFIIRTTNYINIINLKLRFVKIMNKKKKS